MAAAPVDRLRDGRDIGAVLRGRRHRAGRLCVVHVRERGDGGPPRVAVIASKRVGTAVARNRAKRLMREAARRTGFRDGLDVVCIARAACPGRRMPEVLADMRAQAEALGATRSEEATA